MQIQAPYPGFDESRDTIQWGNLYNIDEWREWLSTLGYGFKIENVYRVEFHGGQCTVHQYRRDSDGHAFLDGDNVATLDPITVEYVTPPPPWT